MDQIVPSCVSIPPALNFTKRFIIRDSYYKPEPPFSIFVQQRAYFTTTRAIVTNIETRLRNRFFNRYHFTRVVINENIGIHGEEHKFSNALAVEINGYRIILAFLATESFE